MVLGFGFCFLEVIELLLLYLPLFTHFFSHYSSKLVLCKVFFFNSQYYYQVLCRQPQEGNQQKGSSR